MSYGYSNAIGGDDGNLGLDLSGILGQVGGQAASTGLKLLFGQGSQQHQGFHYPLRDSGEMSAVLDQIWFTKWLPATQSNLPPDQMIAIAAQVKDILYDPQVFQQSGTENDAYLNNFKGWVNTAITAAQAQLAAVPVATTPAGTVPVAVTDPATGQTVIVPQPATATTLGLDTSTLLILGGAGLVLVLLAGRS